MEPEISVVMSVYNGAEYLNEAIESILNQTFEHFEFIIIDDGSTDNSRDIVKSYNDERIVLIEQENTGLAIALNNGIKIAKAGLIARMDADDIALSKRLEHQYIFLKNHLGYILVGSNAIIIDKDGNYVHESNVPKNWEEIKKKFPETSFFHSSVLFRKEPFYKAGCYFEKTSKLFSFEDSILWNKMKEFGMMANLTEHLLKYRLMPNAATTKSGKEGKVILKIVEEIIKTNELSSKNQEQLLKIKKSLSPSEKERYYYIHLAKKYIFNNNQTKKARSNLKKAIKIKVFDPLPYLLFIITFFPNSFIKYIYQKN